MRFLLLLEVIKIRLGRTFNGDFPRCSYLHCCHAHSQAHTQAQAQGVAHINSAVTPRKILLFNVIALDPPNLLSLSPSLSLSVPFTNTKLFHIQKHSHSPSAACSHVLPRPIVAACLGPASLEKSSEKPPHRGNSPLAEN